MLTFNEALELVAQGKATVRYNARLDALVVYEYNHKSPTGVSSCAMADNSPENNAKVSALGKRVSQSSAGF